MAERSSPDAGARDGFYIEPDCCLLCGVPEDIAPELFRTGDASCFLIRQPRSPAEFDKAIVAMGSSEVDCIRYGGSEPGILRRLGEADMASFADDPGATVFRPLIRDRVGFVIPGAPTAAELAVSLRSHLRANGRYTLGKSFRRRTVKFAWSGRHFHSVRFKPADGPAQSARLFPAGPAALQGLARLVDDWLRSGCGAGNILWHTKKTARDGIGGRPQPY